MYIRSVINDWSRRRLAMRCKDARPILANQCCHRGIALTAGADVKVLHAVDIIRTIDLRRYIVQALEKTSRRVGYPPESNTGVIGRHYLIVNLARIGVHGHLV